MLDPIFCWAEIGIWHSDAISKIHLNKGSLKVSLWEQKRERVRIDSPVLLRKAESVEWPRPQLEGNHKVWCCQRKGGHFINLFSSQQRVTPLLGLTQLHCEGGVLQGVCCSPALLITMEMGDHLETILACSPGFLFSEEWGCSGEASPQDMGSYWDCTRSLWKNPHCQLLYFKP